MRVMIASLLVFLFASSILAKDISEIYIKDQDSDQQHCIQDRLPQCIDKCQKVGMNNCDAMCQENIKDECRQAGE